MNSPYARNKKKIKRLGRAWLGRAVPLSFPLNNATPFPQIRWEMSVRKAKHGGGGYGKRHKPVLIIQAPSYVLTGLVPPNPPPVAGEPIPHETLTMKGTPPDRRRKRYKQRGYATPGNFFHTSVAGLTTFSPVHLLIHSDVTWHHRPTQGHSTRQYFITINVAPGPIIPQMLRRAGPIIDQRSRRKRHMPLAHRSDTAILHTSQTIPFIVPGRLMMRRPFVSQRHANRHRHQTLAHLNAGGLQHFVATAGPTAPGGNSGYPEFWNKFIMWG